MEQNEKELLEKLVVECNSYAEMLRKLGKSNSGTATKLLKEKLDDYGITHNFINNTTGGKINKIPLEEILKENRPYKSQDLKRRLIEEGYKLNKCENPECGISEWHGHSLVLQLHHINGNHNDNRLENLQILCPNCHSLTENFNGKKLKKEQKYCPDCGRPINSKSTYCRECGPKHSNKCCKVALEDRPSKEELLEMIKTKTFVDIGKQYGITDNSVRKWCKNYGLPSTKYELKRYLLDPENFIPTPDKEKIQKKLSEKDFNIILKLYNEGYNSSEISNYIGFSNDIINKSLKNFGIKNIRKAHAKKIGQYSLDGKFMNYFYGTGEIIPWILEHNGKDISKGTNHINDCCNGKSNSAYGYIWKYEEKVPIENIINR